ncbi:hypothetical protein [Xanthomonas hortorum]|uniref:Uncharacterized protein n=1 Tax=Xanthomonas hortorum pv. pelargonii TaxID=453602 RepID=A0AAW9ZSB9_9XANT|nr:hypothetical protein [Xanthomonas hortorum]MCE4355122.1 hypothetical protein [Xanthomonas hortorum pv. pelargonii]MCM5524613.1 hypothetical protein [Xanthomonas hortorum pv. pelargonii]MCM5537138.1 hypothetical protein [Xanthomonas hortorum pv. pelargonii]MCM5541239.1 hypothetical protein [Xanthomonas hortorum pv. pelargonii]MCM5545565.1 hypothetical protein [Xanthomonas hortorum pv. pelargonii]
MTRKKVAPAWACVGSSAHGDMPVYAGIGARQEYLGKIQRGDGFEKSITAWALIAQVCRKQSRESNVPDSPAGQIAAFRSNSLMRALAEICSVAADNAHETSALRRALD